MKESRDRVFIQDPPWISSLFMKSLLFRSKNRSGVKIEFQEMERRKYYLLRRRQIKAETEAWESRVEEYRELEREMCERKLAPNLPYVKKLILGWFEPLREAIEKEQNTQRSKKNKAAFAPFIDALPADKMAVIVMHKIMGLLMMGGKDDRCVRVVEAAVQIGVAVEHEVSTRTVWGLKDYHFRSAFNFTCCSPVRLYCPPPTNKVKIETYKIKEIPN